MSAASYDELFITSFSFPLRLFEDVPLRERDGAEEAHQQPGGTNFSPFIYSSSAPSSSSPPKPLGGGGFGHGSAAPTYYFQ